MKIDLSNKLYGKAQTHISAGVTNSMQKNVIKGFHKMGRVEHRFAGEQVGVSQHYVDLALKTMDLMYVEINVGDALFFHSKLLHCSEANLSEKLRWSLISCYNRSGNVPHNEPSKSSILKKK